MGKCKRTVSLLLALVMTVSVLSAGIQASAAGPKLPSPDRRTVLVLDGSAAMEETAAALQKETACRLVNDILNAEDSSEAAIVTMGTAPGTVSPFTDDPRVLTDAMNALSDPGDADIAAAIEEAAELLSSAPGKTENTIILCSGTLPGPDDAEAAQAAAETAERSGITLFAVGFFTRPDGDSAVEARTFMQDLAGAEHSCLVHDPAEAQALLADAGETAGAEAAADAQETGSAGFRKTGCFYYPSFGGQDYAAPFFYTDDYFTESAYTYQDSLATMTLSLALSAFGSARAKETPEEYPDKGQNLEYLLRECGFPQEHYACNQSFREKPGMDSIGAAASHKTIQADGRSYTLIAAAIRGGGYESEWASNFTIGLTGSHRGFSEARDQVLDFLRDYVARQGITGSVKLWIGGYSRAAATTNMVAGALDDGYSLGTGVSLSPDDLYAYCFECPQGAGPDVDVGAPVYQNIFNIVNPCDLVTKVAPTAPEQFGFRRYGVDCYLPTALKEGEEYSALRDAMLTQFHALPSTDDYIVDDFQMKHVAIDRLFWDPSGVLEQGIVVDDDDERWDMNAYLDETIYQLASSCVKSRRNYVLHYEQDIRELCRAVFGCNDRWGDFADRLVENLKARSVRIAACLILHKDRLLRRTVERALEGALREAGITNYSAGRIKFFAVKAAALFVPLGVNSPDLLVTAVYNLMSIGSAHLPEVCMAWLRSFDPNFTGAGGAAFNSGIHRVVRISSPVDIRVYNNDGRLVAAMENGASQALDGSALVTYVNDDGEALIYLPAEETYSVELTADKDQTLSYSVQEYSEAAGGVNRIVNYYDLELRAGETCTGTVPGMHPDQLFQPEGSTVSYALQAPDGRTLTADEDMAGAEAEAADCMVTVSSNNEAYGAVTGSGLVKVGGYAKLTAIANEGCCFEGWYADGQLISRESEYRVCVTEDLSVVGRFAPLDEELPWTVDFTWSEDSASCTAVFTRSGTTEQVQCTVSRTETPATTQSDGRIVCTASVEFHGRTYTDTHVQVIPKLPQQPIWKQWLDGWKRLFPSLWG